MKPLRKSDRVMLIVGALAIGTALSFMIEDYRDYRKSIPVKTVKEEWCLLKTIQPGESIVESNSGNYNYQLIATSKGIDVYVKCE